MIHFIHSYVNDGTSVGPARWPAGGRMRTSRWGPSCSPSTASTSAETTAAINGFVQPIIDRYLRGLAGELAARGCPRELLVMQGNGGAMSVDVAARHAVNTLMSGPAAGVKAAAFGRSRPVPQRHQCDMGGTSFDVGVIVATARPPSAPTRKWATACPSACR